ncbi:arginine deiminase family protein [Agreia sp. PsM10]|uniref:dimethylargininase n=1 Tax=Agreia sp. PsM10 TaxID=3030533 RepID=UPI00263B2EEB|nr:dimethylargininase [Agreia sp. PsM10]MDN4641180.1 arginine deiminase family protein [Agreia sp. PsM10]
MRTETATKVAPMHFLRPRPLIASAVAALLVAAITHLATMLSFFVGNDPQSIVLLQINNFFVPSTLVLLVLVFVFALATRLWRWYTAAIAGLVSGAIAAVVGTGIQTLVQGNALDGPVIAYILSTLGNINLIFVLTATVATATLGRRVYGALSHSEVPPRSVAGTVLVRRPSDNLAEGIVTHLERTEVDSDLADTQWESYVAALIGAGWKPVEVERATDLADSVFVEDSVVMFGRLAVLASPAAPTRVAEIDGVEKSVRSLGLDVTRIVQPGTLDGGDVLKIEKRVYVGRGGRTNAEGIRQLRHILSPLAYTVIAVPISKVLHLKSAVTALPDGTVIGYPPVVDDPKIFDRFLAVPEEAGAHVVILSDDTVLMSSAAPESAQLIESLGYRVIAVDISEFEKLEACVTCLSVRVR